MSPRYPSIFVGALSDLLPSLAGEQKSIGMSLASVYSDGYKGEDENDIQ